MNLEDLNPYHLEQTEQNRDLAQQILHWLEQPRFADPYMATPEYGNLRDSLYNQSIQDILSQAQSALGPLPSGMGAPPQPNLQMLVNSGYLTPEAAGELSGDWQAPLQTETGSLQDYFAQRGGTRGSGAYAAALGKGLAGVFQALNQAGNQATTGAYQLGVQERDATIRAAQNQAALYAGLPRVAAGNAPIEPEEGPPFEFPNPYANLPSANEPSLAGPLIGAGASILTGALPYLLDTAFRRSGTGTTPPTTGYAPIPPNHPDMTGDFGSPYVPPPSYDFDYTSAAF